MTSWQLQDDSSNKSRKPPEPTAAPSRTVIRCSVIYLGVEIGLIAALQCETNWLAMIRLQSARYLHTEGAKSSDVELHLTVYYASESFWVPDWRRRF